MHFFRSCFEENFNHIIRGRPKGTIFEGEGANWIDVLPLTAKQYIYRLQNSTKITSMESSSKEKEGYVYQNLLDKRKKLKAKFTFHDLVRTADLKKTFSKRDSITCSYILHEFTEINNHIIPRYKIDYLPERYNEALQEITYLTMKKNNSVMKKLNTIT